MPQCRPRHSRAAQQRQTRPRMYPVRHVGDGGGAPRHPRMPPCPIRSRSNIGAQFTILRTLLTQIRPIELVVEKSLSTKVRAILKTNCCRRISDHFMQVLPKYVAMLSRNLGCSAPASKLTEASSSTPSFTPIFTTVHAYVEMPSNHVLSFLLSSEGPDFLWLGLE
jgi:hypothetical protein